MAAFTSIALGATAAFGVGSSIYGMTQQQKGYDQMRRGYEMQQRAAAQAAVYQKRIVEDEQKQEAVRRQVMELDAGRQQTQILRQAQAARAMALAAATSQGAGFAGGVAASSSLLGGMAQIKGDEGFNILGVKQNLYAGREMFDINADISQQKLGLADTQTQMYAGQGQVSMGQGMVGQGSGFMSLGSSLVGLAGTVGNIAGNFGGGQNYQSPFGSGYRTAYNPGRIGSLY